MFSRSLVALSSVLLLSCGAQQEGGSETLSRADALEAIEGKGIAHTVSDFHQAAARGDEELLKLFLASGMEIDSKGEQGITALMWAASQGHLDAAGLLLEKGADPHLKDGDGWTAMMSAKALGYTRTVRLLEENGARR